MRTGLLVVVAVTCVVTILKIFFLGNASIKLLPIPQRRSTTMSSTAGTMRAVRQVVQGQRMMEGAGVRIFRTTRDMQGVIKDGGVQWMTAGRGIVHSEMPQITKGDLHGFQLWINLPKKDKMIKPRYQDYQASDIPSVENGDNANVRVMAGSFLDTVGPIELRNPGLLMDVRISPGGTFKHAFPVEWNAFAYIYEGEGTIGEAAVVKQHAVVMDAGDYVQAAASDQGLHFLLMAGQPIGEPIVQHGPFVMNTQEEIKQAFADYQSGRLQSNDDNVWAAWSSA